MSESTRQALPARGQAAVSRDESGDDAAVPHTQGGAARGDLHALMAAGGNQAMVQLRADDGAHSVAVGGGGGDPARAPEAAHEASGPGTDGGTGPVAEATAAGGVTPEQQLIHDRQHRAPGDPTSVAAAHSLRAQHRTWYMNVLRRALQLVPDPAKGPHDRDNVLHNSAQWMTEGNAVARLFTLTHDSHRRAEVGAGEGAYFDRTTTVEGGGSYVPRQLHTDPPQSDPAINVASRSGLGTMNEAGTELTLINLEGERDVEEILQHEVQHDADLHDAGEAFHDAATAQGPAKLASSGADFVNLFKSEFRSYWMNEVFGAAHDTRVTPFTVTAVHPGDDLVPGNGDDGRTRTVTTAFQNKRQADIFVQLMGGASNRSRSVWYDHDRGGWLGTYGWAPHYYAQDPNFKAMVDAYTQPEGGNLINSTRIQRLVDAIESGAADRVQAVAAELDANDRAYLSDRRVTKAFWDTAKTLDGPTLAALEAVIAGERGPAPEAGPLPVPDYAREPAAGGDDGPPAERVAAFEEPEAEAAPTSAPRRPRHHGGGGARVPTFEGEAERGSGERVIQPRANDSLSKIAARELGDASRWREIAALNPQIRPPDYIVRRSMQIRLPA